jgi:SAM-dependent methyltransferase
MSVAGIETQLVACYNCGSTATAPYDVENGWHLVKCQGCGLLYVNPRPADGEITQANKTGEHRGEGGALDWVEVYDRKKVRKYQQVLRDLFSGPGELLSPKPGQAHEASGPEEGTLLAKASHRRRWLDIGCGYGEFLEGLGRFTGGRIEGVGVEPNVEKRARALAKGLNVPEIDLDTHGEKYEYWSLLNVYSHLPDPVKVLDDWKRLLAPRGEIVLQTGDSGDLPWEHHHRPYRLPDHLHFATERIVCDILERIGFEIVKVCKYRLAKYPRPTPLALAKATARIFRPGLKANFGVMFNPPVRPDRDMYVRARLKK